MAGPNPHTDLERDAFAQRRRILAVRLVPVLGIFLFLLPLLFGLGPETVGSTARIGLYLFFVWAILIAMSAWLSYKLDTTPPSQEEGQE